MNVLWAAAAIAVKDPWFWGLGVLAIVLGLVLAVPFTYLLSLIYSRFAHLEPYWKARMPLFLAIALGAPLYYAVVPFLPYAKAVVILMFAVAVLIGGSTPVGRQARASAPR